ncbi:hypothetical protein KEM60_02648 [Austwickia sp. TVS 96-490-7B]|uniref:zinc ribbon domain-containing protein n=1 Tax=Austwickia sp. TVS 96-490-7B TaxID=2830843 RepID=UPI001C55F15C|nr:C4-type zinc ribbon domain-containing protein [Austwickia sp. TVS 96-490-7B]MBW3086430.1 hypothetical protein [Austwickia sp. TVS 96-490-7B]
MKAEHERQLRLLDLQALDTRLAQIAHRLAKLPAQQRVDELSRARNAAESDLVKAKMQASDVSREVTKAEADVQVVRDRMARDQARLDAGVSAKEALSLQHELESLTRRQAALEDDQLDVMERAEATAGLVAYVEGCLHDVATELAEAVAVRDEARSALETEAEQVRRRRADMTPLIGDDLLALYEKILAQTGMGAAAVLHRRCEGCRLELLGDDVARIKKAPVDEVVRCEECRRILVRTAESGL